MSTERDGSSYEDQPGLIGRGAERIKGVARIALPQLFISPLHEIERHEAVMDESHRQVDQLIQRIDDATDPQ